MIVSASYEYRAEHDGILSTMGKSKSGFTIVELLIVIVVIAVLAAITIVAFNGIQGRAKDSQRIQDMTSIAKALEVYRINNGEFPDEVQTAGAGGWELSTDGTSATNFLSALVTSRTINKVPLDPRNTGSSSVDPGNSSAHYLYFYHRYGAGASGCDVAKGDFYILGVTRMDTIESGGIHPNSPGFSCSGQNWGATRGAWVTGGYTNNR